MSEFSGVLEKLNAFVKKYYKNELLKGAILFSAFGFLIFLLVTGVEYFLWLNSTGRLILLVALVVVEVYLLYRFIGVPLAYLLRLRKGIDNKTASYLIGKHFNEVSDKLTNLLELYENKEKSDLLEASIDQKSVQLIQVPFSNAIRFKGNIKFLRFLIIPLIIVLTIALSGRLQSFFEGYTRVRNFDMAYAAPAPFEFLILNEKLDFLENEEVLIKLQTRGEVIPEDMVMLFNGKEYLMQSNGNQFSYNLGSNVESGTFSFMTNGFNSAVYRLEVGAVPSIQGFSMSMVYPKYLGRNDEIINGTGNAVIPEGTKVKLTIEANNTTTVSYKSADTILKFQRNDRSYEFSKTFYNNAVYSISTSNENVNDFEELGYRIDVIKDQYPKIKVVQSIDSLSPNESFYNGLVSDDYGIKSTSLIYYPTGQPELKTTMLLSKNSGTGNSFQFTFPNGLAIEKGASYQLYFEVKDNDGVHGGKVARSEVFNAMILNDEELREKELDSYKSVLDKFQNTMSKQEEQEKAFEEINKIQKENESLSFNDKRTIKDFLKRQESQEKLLKDFSDKLSKDLEKTQENSEFNELLKERWERQELEAEKNRKLLEELNKISDKIENEKLQEKLEELAKKQSSGKRNLEQLLELTKRYYVTEKANQLANDLENLSKKQELLSKIENEESFNREQQEKLNKEYEDIDKELEELKNDNNDLKKPLNLEIQKSTQEQIKDDQQSALDEIGKHQSSEQSSSGNMSEQEKQNTSAKMNSAAQKMKKLSEGLRQSTAMMSGGGSTIAEDAEMLRQILENLVTFSFKQEELFDKVNNSEFDLNQSSYSVKKQQELRGLFEHVDDSLFALSLRQPELSEFVNDQITEVYYNIDKALDNIAENQIFQGASYQQYVLNASNSLADYLADMLDNMQQSLMQGQGQGQGDGFQLPDIIKAQQQLGEKMGQMSGQGQNGKQQGDGKSGEGKQNGEQGKTDGKDGNQGEDGGENGQKAGKKGNGKGQGEDGQNGNSSSGGEMSEQNLSEIYEIFKEQQTIREALEKQLDDFISNPDNELAKKLIRQMESFENDLLENGITQRTQNRMNTIRHQLMKLENAAMEQGKKEERQSETNGNIFSAPIGSGNAQNPIDQPSIEILSRQALPLHGKLSKKVQGYFEQRN